MNVFIILGVLFLALIVIVPLIEKSGVKMSDEATSKVSRFIWPLIAIVLAVQMFTYFF